MYERCLACKRPLGHTRVRGFRLPGRAFALDAVKGRVWVICRRCAMWNLLLEDDRAQALPLLEQLVADGRPADVDANGTLFASGGAAVLQLSSASSGQDALFHFAPVFVRRRRLRWLRHSLLYGTMVSIVAAALQPGMRELVILAPAFAVLYTLTSGWRERWRRQLSLLGEPTVIAIEGDLNIAVRVVADEPTVVSVRVSSATSAALGRPGWRDVAGLAALEVLCTVLRRANDAGASMTTVNHAVRLLESRGTPLGRPGSSTPSAAASVAWTAGRVSRTTIYLDELDELERIALEIAALRCLVDRVDHLPPGELAAVWKEADEVAGIAESLP